MKKIVISVTVEDEPAIRDFIRLTPSALWGACGGLDSYFLDQ
jgi:hypothetical protein